VLPERVFVVKGAGRLPCVTIPRYRCTMCGNLTRFDVTATRRTTAFHHYSVGGELTVEEEQVLAHDVESVTCRWCGSGSGVVEIGADEAAAEAGPGPSGA
jgi:hypothetical protein